MGNGYGLTTIGSPFLRCCTQHLKKLFLYPGGYRYPRGYLGLYASSTFPSSYIIFINCCLMQSLVE